MKRAIMSWMCAGVFAFVVLSAVHNVYGQDKAGTGELLGDGSNFYTVAVFPFVERNASVKGMGGQVSDLVFAGLAGNPAIWLVEREEMQKILDESELNLSGVVGPNEAIQIGQLTGARIIVTGSIFVVNDKTYIVAKVIGTETSRVLGKSVSGTEGIDKLSEKLSESVSGVISEEGRKLVAQVKNKEDMLSGIKAAIGDKEKPVVFVKISESHIGQRTVDPAAETEIQLICKELGFTVTMNENEADVLIEGEGFSEFSTRRGNLISVKARLEVKAYDKSKKLLAADRQTDVQVGLSETITGKQALQEAAAKIAERLLPKICK